MNYLWRSYIFLLILIDFILCIKTVVTGPINGTLLNDVYLSKGKEVCMKELGCFDIPPEFTHILYRPLNVLPMSRQAINTQHLLYTRNNPKEPDLLLAYKKESILESNFNKDHPVKFIVHGFMDSEYFGPWMVHMKDEFVMKGDYNIIIVDWSGGNKPPYYQATANTRVVGAELANMIKALQKYVGVRPEDCHIIGHSLGAHVAGYAGERIKTVGRITGCDPAEPYFQNMPPSVRLDTTDAEYVDVIHTDATTILLLGFGMSQMIGHVDFFPNNGRKQPGCKSTNKLAAFIIHGLNEGSRRLISCDHQRALDFMHYSINYKKAPPVGYECSDWESFLQGKCASCGSDTSMCAVMGIRADEYKPFKNSSIQRALYLKTSGEPPFWLYHYQVTVKLHKPRVSYKESKGSFEVVLHGSKEDFLANLQNDDDNLYHGTRYQYLVTTEKELSEILSVTFTWYSSSKNPLKFIFKPELYVEYIAVVPMNSIEKSPRNMKRKIFCNSKPETPIVPKTLTSLTMDDSCM